MLYKKKKFCSETETTKHKIESKSAAKWGIKRRDKNQQQKSRREMKIGSRFYRNDIVSSGN